MVRKTTKIEKEMLRISENMIEISKSMFICTLFIFILTNIMATVQIFSYAFEGERSWWIMGLLTIYLIMITTMSIALWKHSKQWKQIK
ncbi:hypothetical protein COU37_00740 [Candidatus Micrarchaeota archaeon CG10_big_fil_rev_8_21_14_0_10_45_29]|nr:MAG: hypothetical protein COU37_00740 [Candidatus Micrarchaeota archaeon CG10_big_fil_rev_8_21_14_0_10_45_29]